MITVYSKTDCQQCRATKRLLDRLGAPFNVVDVNEDRDAAEYLANLGYKSVPVVIVEKRTGIDHWFGYRPDSLKRAAGNADTIYKERA